MSMNGWVYVLGNESMPDIVKIGFTTKDPGARAKELSGSTGVPMPFFVEYGIVVADPEECEKRAHNLLEEQRLNEGREFFKCTLGEAISAIRKAAGNGIQFEGHRNGQNTKAVQENSLGGISFQLIGLIRFLKGDGDLTNHEIYRLAEWLNTNPDECDKWPGIELVEPLKEFYKDGELSRHELHQISLLMIEIENQFKDKFVWGENEDSDGVESAKEHESFFEGIRKKMNQIK